MATRWLVDYVSWSLSAGALFATSPSGALELTIIRRQHGPVERAAVEAIAAGTT